MIWLWLREGKSYGYGIVGAIVLILYGILPTLQKFPSFGKVYAAYGGRVYCSLASLGMGCGQKNARPVGLGRSRSMPDWRFDHAVVATALMRPWISNVHEF